MHERSPDQATFHSPTMKEFASFVYNQRRSGPQRAPLLCSKGLQDGSTTVTFEGLILPSATAVEPASQPFHLSREPTTERRETTGHISPSRGVCRVTRLDQPTPRAHDESQLGWGMPPSYLRDSTQRKLTPRSTCDRSNQTSLPRRTRTTRDPGTVGSAYCLETATTAGLAFTSQSGRAQNCLYRGTVQPSVPCAGSTTFETSSLNTAVSFMTGFMSLTDAPIFTETHTVTES